MLVKTLWEGWPCPCCGVTEQADGGRTVFKRPKDLRCHGWMQASSRSQWDRGGSSVRAFRDGRLCDETRSALGAHRRRCILFRDTVLGVMAFK